ncbi:MAG TPA: nucleotidyltransferase family protein [Terracidiphilus sp.]|jgi:molybdenum cofactor cytidylyltransferase|nr:nucleotidyltransferase family protein [Terracidiphilus sp.]
MRIPVVAIIVAAGASSRLGQPKQLLPVDGEPLLQRAVRCALEAGAGPVLVVLGAYRERIEKAVELGATTVVANAEWEEGMASSIRAGVRAVDEGAGVAGVLLMTCDQPRITAKHLLQMLEEFDAHEGTMPIASTYGGVRGTPAIFPRAMFADLLALRGDRGARGLLAKTSLPIVEIPLEGGEVDIDRPEDLAELN